MQFVDAVEISGTKRRADGALLTDARVARIGIQMYAGHEVGKPELAMVRVLRSADEVFAPESIASYAHRPVTNDHPKEAVTSDNWRQHAVGNTADEVVRDGGRVRIPLMVSDGAAIADVESGKRQLSAGYTCDLDFTPGVSEFGAFDAQQRNIRINHIAIVQRGRAGEDVRIGDNAPGDWGVRPLPLTSDNKDLPPMLKITIDGISFEMSDTAAQGVNKLLSERDTLKADLQRSTADTSVLLAAKDKEIGTKDAEIAKLQGAKLDDAAIDALVEARSAVLADVSLVANDIETRGKSVADIRRAAVSKAMGDAKVAGKSDEYVEALFDGLVENAKGDPVRKHLGDQQRQPFIPTLVGDKKDNGQSAYEKRLSDGWKNTNPAKEG